MVATKEYYEHGVTKGEWLGRLASEWGLRGEAEPEAVESLLSHRHPVTGISLAQRNHATPRNGYDYTFSAPKSISIAALEDPRITEAFQRAVKTAFVELEEFAARRYRTGTAANSNDVRITNKLAATMYCHGDSRAHDPQMHAHVVIYNVTEDGDKPYALETQLMSQVIKKSSYVRLAFHSQLARNLDALGYVVEKGEYGEPVIAGISQSTQTLFAKRGEQMLAAVEDELLRRKALLSSAPSTILERTELRSWLASRGERWSDLGANYLSGAEKAVIATSSRSKKTAGPGDLEAYWWGQMSSEQREELRGVVAKARARTTTLSSNQNTEALAFATAHIFERRSAVPRYMILAAAMENRFGKVDIGLLKTTQLPSDTVAGLGDGVTQLYTTEKHLADERYSVDAINRGKSSVEPINAFFRCDVLRSGETWRPGKVSAAQAKAIEALLSSRDSVVLLRGVAGAGKTSSLQIFNAVARDSVDGSSGYSLIYLAPSTQAVEVLRAEGFPALTVARFLTDPGVRTSLNPKTIVVCDEAGMLSTSQGYALLRSCCSAEARLLLVGDTAQHSGVEAGDWVRLLSENSSLATVSLTEVHRQTEQNYRIAANLIVNKSVRSGLEKFDALGWIIECAEPDKAISESYLKARLAGKDYLAVAPTHTLIHKSTGHIRSGLIAHSLLGSQTVEVISSQSLNLTFAQKKDPASYKPGQILTFRKKVPGTLQTRVYTVLQVGAQSIQVAAPNGSLRILPLSESRSWDLGERIDLELREGDRLQITANDKKAKLINGEVLTFAAMHPKGGIMTLEGKTIPKHFGDLRYGYVVTSHKSQGSTRDSAGIFAGKDAKSLLVSLTRAKKEIRIFTENKHALFQAAEISGNRTLAVDAIYKPTTTPNSKMNALPDGRSISQAASTLIAEKLSEIRDRETSGSGFTVAGPALVSQRDIDAVLTPILSRLASDASHYSTLTNAEQSELLKRISNYCGDGPLQDQLANVRSNLPFYTSCQLPSDRQHLEQERAADAREQLAGIRATTSALRATGDTRAANAHEDETALERINLLRESEGKSPITSEYLARLNPSSVEGKLRAPKGNAPSIRSRLLEKLKDRENVNANS